jgi:hypothetical protein
MNKIPLTDKNYLLEKFPGKGGWTYALIPEIPMEKRFPFGWMKVHGYIDGFELENYKLMPFGNGLLFLPVNAKIRKAIKKEAGDYVNIQLFECERPQGIPQEILDCLKDAPKALSRFYELADWEQKLYIDSILDAKNQDTKVERIVLMIEKLDY